MKTKNMMICALFAALMAVGANVSPFLTIGGVPVTLQLLFAILAGGILGSRLGAVSMVTYMLIGLVGAPVFAQFKGGPAQLLSPTFGFILSFIAVAYVTGKLVGDKVHASKTSYLTAALLSLFLNYMIGTNLMFAAFKYWAETPDGFSYLVAWGWMAAYLPIDIGVAILSFALIPKLKVALKGTFRVEKAA
ncbi:biotin transporter BioY [Fictibacillus sp. b24]|uniref:biotin transporter BioY n=1 Tax=Fictibacillus sp. b24 TaxID=3055863 RepID=UPI0025A30D5D|nr:biotin transporter BioY [Fictibacillus sp. b24]MDM5317325.1 biotin transporter BioY [Fictibacillus sp. b24]